MATLYIVATPIGNLEDITLRALDALKAVDVILCEDTRMTKRLLDRYGVTKQLLSYNAHSTDKKTESIIAMLEEGKTLALVSDAGTPGISDPGCLIVKQVREHFKNEVAIVPIPGPSALATALSVSGLPSSDFLFLGFLPHKKGRKTLFKEIVLSKRTVVFYESPHRISKALEVLRNVLDKSRLVVIARELSKIHEEVISGTIEEICSYFTNNPDKQRGEFVCMVEGTKNPHSKKNAD